MKKLLTILILSMILLVGCVTPQGKIERIEREISKAKEMQDISICDNLPEIVHIDQGLGHTYTTGRYFCYTAVARAKEDSSICDKIPYVENLKRGITHKHTKITCYDIIASLKGDISICDKIEDQTYKSNCYESVSLQTGDTSICDVLENEMWNEEEREWNRNKCYKSIALVQKDPSICAKIETQNWRNSCYQELTTTHLLDISLCDKIEGESLFISKDKCYLNLGAQLKDPSICAKIESEEEKNDCYGYQ